MSTGIVILNYNNFSDTINCIQSVFQHCLPESYILVIVDNGSQNDSTSQIENHFKHKNIEYQTFKADEIQKRTCKNIIIQTNENLGYAKGNNVGIRFLLTQSVDNILILNNDIILQSDIILSLSNCLNMNPQIGLISPLLMKDEQIIDYNCCRKNPTNKMLLYESLSNFKIKFFKKAIESKYILKAHPELLKNELVTCDIVSGACIMAKSGTWQMIDGFDENTFLYYEENILFEKLKKLNLLSAIYIPVSVIHLGAKATKKIKNTKILRIDLESLTYYLKTYRKVGIVTYTLIRLSRLFHIRLIAANNFRKKLF